MTRPNLLRYFLAVFAVALAFVAPDAKAGKPLKVYILAGQSNMEGHAKTTTLGYIGENPKTAPLYKMLTDEAGNPAVADRVWVSNLTGFKANDGVTTGKLTAGFGARRDPAQLGEKIGPELSFGLTMQEAYDGPILIIKCAWGGKSLHTDFRPPSAGAYVFNEGEIATIKNRGQDLAQVKAEKKVATGHYYRLMTEHVKRVLADPGQVVPGYDKDAGYELAGFVWFQGWNDMVARSVYPKRDRPGGYDDYSKWLGLFIKDVRKDFNAPQMPFVIGAMGVGGPIDPSAKNKVHLYFRQAMAAPAEKLNGVVAVPTAPYWDQTLDAIAHKRYKINDMARFLRTKHKDYANADGSMSKEDQKTHLARYEADLISPQEKALWERGASNKAYHYLGCGKTLAQIGQAFANALLDKP